VWRTAALSSGALICSRATAGSPVLGPPPPPGDPSSGRLLHREHCPQAGVCRSGGGSPSSGRRCPPSCRLHRQDPHPRAVVRGSDGRRPRVTPSRSEEGGGSESSSGIGGMGGGAAVGGPRGRCRGREKQRCVGWVGGDWVRYSLGKGRLYIKFRSNLDHQIARSTVTRS
jgi:hypothetical protein